MTSYLSRRHGLAERDARVQAEELLILVGSDLAPVTREAVARNWWVYALRGALAILVGALFLMRPGASLAALVLLFGAWAFFDGVIALAWSVAQRRSWRLAIVGVVGIVIGVLTFFRPGLTALALYSVVAAWSIVKGILEIGIGIELRRALRGGMWMVLDGLLSIALGVFLIVLPQAGVLALAWLIGFYALAFGGFLVGLGVRLWRLTHPRHARREPTPQPA